MISIETKSNELSIKHLAKTFYIISMAMRKILPQKKQLLYDQNILNHSGL
ncbi:hypothetical protein NBRC110019_29880 [Neptunitalea chrysea]|uniref:Uncharacterized protein n=1 Tax=Neptunitalea chrysea TaxID=1647581 RepID=A0A9W6EWI4_9FLAO|nr:hypothetical protein NBRC110019_29880 [Neptunitalea chrysea]